MGRTILVTGASGAIGPHLLAELLRDEDNDEIFVLMRPGSGMAMRMHALRRTVEDLATDGHPQRLSVAERLHPIATDIRCDNLGLQDCDRESLQRHVDVVIHAAANTRFAAPVGELREVNVVGDTARSRARTRVRAPSTVPAGQHCVRGREADRHRLRATRGEGK